jgi:hypothetical protein
VKRSESRPPGRLSPTNDDAIMPRPASALARSRFYEEAERRRAALRQAERAIGLPFDSLASLVLDRALVDLEMLAEGLP